MPTSPDKSQPMDIEVETNQSGGPPPPPPPASGVAVQYDPQVVIQYMIAAAQNAACIQAQISAERDRTRRPRIVKEVYDAGVEEAQSISQGQTKSYEKSKQLLDKALGVIWQMATTVGETANAIKKMGTKKRTKQKQRSDMEVETSSKKKPPSTTTSSGSKGN